MSISDTGGAAREVQIEVQRALTGEQRVLLAFEMSLFIRDLARARIQSDHPEWNEAQIAREMLRLAFLPASLPANLR